MHDCRGKPTEISPNLQPPRSHLIHIASFPCFSKSDLHPPSRSVPCARTRNRHCGRCDMRDPPSLRSRRPRFRVRARCDCPFMCVCLRVCCKGPPDSTTCANIGKFAGAAMRASGSHPKRGDLHTIPWVRAPLDVTRRRSSSAISMSAALLQLRLFD